MSEYYKIIEKIEGISTCQYLCSQRAILFQQLLPKLGSQAHFNAMWRRGKQVENNFQGVAKGKYARTGVCLTMKTTDLKCFMLHFILNGYGDNHHLLTRDKSPENIILVALSSTVTRVVSNCFRSSVVTFLACKVTYKIVFLCNVYIK